MHSNLRCGAKVSLTYCKSLKIISNLKSVHFQGKQVCLFSFSPTSGLGSTPIWKTLVLCDDFVLLSEQTPFNLLYTGRLFHYYMLDEPICHFKGVGSILSLLCYF